jgi:hypothetical protein
MNNLQGDISNKVNDIIDKVNKASSGKNSQEDNLKNIPPVYVKRQNGEIDFKNNDIINNIETMPQFTN